MVVCISILQPGCTPGTLKNEQMTPAGTATGARSPACGDPLVYFSGLTTQANRSTSTADATTLSEGQATKRCVKLQKAIFLSMPGSSQQNDEAALALLNDLKRTGTLSGSDLQFTNMLSQHVAQRQDLRRHAATQQKRLADVEAQNTLLRNRIKTLQSQLDQLKNIEVEIGIKERALTSPTND